MAFVYCRQCGWEQDDFWSEDYNPFKSLMDWKDVLLNALKEPPEKRTIKFDIEFIRQYQLPCKGPNENGDYEMPIAEFLALEVHNVAESMANMEWLTAEDFKNDPRPSCPICSSTNLEVD
jgi:hypothetical protein